MGRAAKIASRQKTRSAFLISKTRSCRGELVRPQRIATPTISAKRRCRGTLDRGASAPPRRVFAFFCEAPLNTHNERQKRQPCLIVAKLHFPRAPFGKPPQPCFIVSIEGLPQAAFGKPSQPCFIVSIEGLLQAAFGKPPRFLLAKQAKSTPPRTGNASRFEK